MGWVLYLVTQNALCIGAFKIDPNLVRRTLARLGMG